jgi:hypothetical protein
MEVLSVAGDPRAPAGAFEGRVSKPAVPSRFGCPALLLSSRADCILLTSSFVVLFRVGAHRGLAHSLMLHPLGQLSECLIIRIAERWSGCIEDGESAP